MGEGGAEVKDMSRKAVPMRRHWAKGIHREWAGRGGPWGAEEQGAARLHARAGGDPGADRVDCFRRGRSVHDGDHPLWGDTGRMMDGDPPATDAELRAEQMARLREEMRRREVEG